MDSTLKISMPGKAHLKSYRGALLGHARKFMNDKYDEIITFAELKEFEDRPFKQTGFRTEVALGYLNNTIIRK